MILRKPYAFLIKHFKLLHMIILVCIAFTLLNLNDISHLFRTLQSTSTYLYAGADVFINKNIYLFLGVALVISSIVFALFKKKNKPTRLYLFLILYLSTAILCYFYIYKQMHIIMDNAVDSEIIILVKDLSFLLTIPGYIFIVVCFIRGIGFNIKKFNFSKDLDDLQISEKDREEFEFTLGQNNYKYMRTIRRTIRELKYYFLENKFAISMISLAIVVALSIVGVYYYNGYLKKLKETESASVNGITYTVNDSYITANDFNGEKIKEGYKYVVVDLSLYNVTNYSKTLDLAKIVLSNGQLLYYPTLIMNGKFYDLGKPYEEKQVILPSAYVEATLSFEIPETVTSNNYTLKVQYNLEGVLDRVKANYKNFDVNAQNIDQANVSENHGLNEQVVTNVVNKNHFEFNIKSYEIKDTYSSKYIRCSTFDNCKFLSSVISTTINKIDYKNNTMLVLDYDAILDNNANFYKTLNTYDKIFSNYLTVVYKINDRIYRVKAKTIDNKNIDNKVFIQVDRNIVYANSIYLEFSFRNYNYIVNLK